MTDSFSIRARLRSLRYALRGIAEMLRSQHNSRVHLGATLAVLVAGLYFRLGGVEWCLLIFAVALVWVTEALNTALELLCDVASPEFHPLVAKCKDVAAAAVLLSAIAALVVGLVIFIPYLLVGR